MNCVVEILAVFDQCVVNRDANLLGIEKGETRIPLGIQIEEKGLVAFLSQGGGEIDCGCGLPDATLLVCDREDQEGFISA